MKMKYLLRNILVMLFILLFSEQLLSQTVALWLFDEQPGLYPSCVLDDAGPNDYPLVIGQGGVIVPGKFGNALEPSIREEHGYIANMLLKNAERIDGGEKFGLKELPVPEGRTVKPMTWINARFCAFMTGGENHLRKQVGFPHVTETKMNLGDFDWTVEFWFKPVFLSKENGVIFEIGTGPRGENNQVTKLLYAKDMDGFILVNEPADIILNIPSNGEALNPQHKEWHHAAFVYDSNDKQLSHFLDGKRQLKPEKCTLKSLLTGEEDYMSIGRNGLWNQALSGQLDELRFSAGMVYKDDFIPPESFSPLKISFKNEDTSETNLPLLFAQNETGDDVIDLGQRSYLFIDDAIVERKEHISFVVNPPQIMECVIDSIEGAFRKHVSVIEDEYGLIRLYYGGPDDYLEVQTSHDGIRWEKPDLKHGEFHGLKNIAIPEPTAMGNVFIDPIASPQKRWKYVTGYHDRGVYVYSSPDGWLFKREKTAILPFRAGSQSNVFYDDQRKLYIEYHRSDFGKTVAGETQREFVMVEAEDILSPHSFEPVSAKESIKAAKTKRLREPNPWYLDNGPLTPGGFGIEFPAIFAPIDSIDPVGTDIYVPKAIKYPWAPDVYLAFPLFYFHYESDGPLTRRTLMDPERRRGSGPIETQLSVSRDGIHWTRFPRPTYVGIGQFGNHDIRQAYTAHGLIRRGNEIWQYVFAETRDHSSWLEKGEYVRAVYRLRQRLDGFVSADTPYDKEGIIVTKPLKFKGNHLKLNIDTDAAGYAQIGFLNEKGEPVDGFSVDNCVYINGDFIDTNVEWLDRGTDISELSGKTIQIVFRMRGCKLYSMKFTD